MPARAVRATVAAIARRLPGSRGVSSIEYAVIGSLLVVGCVGAITTIGVRLETYFAAMRDAFR